MCVLFQTQAASVLFVDNPVGTGFSYTDSPDAYATDVAAVASDMLVLLRNFFTEKPEFQVLPQLQLGKLYCTRYGAINSRSDRRIHHNNWCCRGH